MTLRRRLAAIICTAALLASLSGCASVFDKDYYSVSAYVDTDTDAPSEGDASEVRNYFGLKLAITRMVNAHEEQATLNFRRYDGSISEDIASACREVSRGTALGDYCVDYISYDLDRIIAYYEAGISVSYKRSAEEVDSIVRLTGSQTVRDALKTALSELVPAVAIMANSLDTDAERVAGFVEEAWHEDPVKCVFKPSVETKIYSGGGLQRIFEVSFDYGATVPAMRSKSDELAKRVAEISEGIIAEKDASLALRAANHLLSVCVCDSGAGSDAWSALMEGKADSEGIAAAYKAVCDALGVEAKVIAGRHGGARYCWNLIYINGAWYHVDLFRSASAGIASCFLKSDAAVMDDYSWNSEDYPACVGDLTYSAVFGDEPEEPAVTPRPTPVPTPSPDVSPAPDTPSPTDDEQNT